jgi:bisphosphoglycerate-dependent phosphoglycerate mutase
MPKATSAAWNYFSKETSDEAKCNTSNVVIKCKGSSTSALINHLITIHGIVIKTKTDGISTSEPPKKQPRG